MDKLFEQYWSYGRDPRDWNKPNGVAQTALFRQMLEIPEADANRPKNGDRLQNGARL